MSAELRVLILGATSGIAAATARLYAAEGASLLLVARDPVRLAAMSSELLLAGAAACQTECLDLASSASTVVLERLAATLGGIDHILIAYAVMPPQSDVATDLALAAKVIDTNYTSTAQWALAAASLLERQGHGSLVVLGSVAGDRGRAKNFVYASTKAAIETLVEGIAHRFAGTPLRAVVVKPGPTATAMTAGSPPGRHLVPAETVARIVRAAAERGGPVQYAPRYWWWIMQVVRALPWWLFRRTKI
jgi:short-subunit dehydrogenase